MIIDMNKRYKTRSGLNVTILITKKIGDYPVVALIHSDRDNDAVGFYSIKGEYYCKVAKDPYDLIETLPLEPCPFCGNIDIQVDYYGTIEEDKYCNIKCCNCGIQTKNIYGHSTEDIKNKAFSYWNTRYK